MATLLFARGYFSHFLRRPLWPAAIVSLAAALACFHAAENCPAADEANPLVKEPAAASPAGGSTSQQLLSEFRQAYALPDDKVVKRVAPPFSPGRLEFYRVHNAEQAKAIPRGPEYMWFRWDKPKPNPLPTNWPRFQEGKLSQAGMGWVGGKGPTVAHLIESFTGIHSYEMQGDLKLKWTCVPGDWVILDGVPAEKMLQGLEAVFRDECKLPVRLRLVEKDRQTIVAEGTYNYRPLPGRSTVTEDHKYGYEGNDLQDYDQLEIFEQDRDGLTDEQSGSLGQLLSFLTQIIDRPVIGGDIKLPADMTSTKPSEREHLLEWRSRNVRLREALEKGTLDEAAILKHLGEQTGLSFSEKPRRVRVLEIQSSNK
jgi:hypothetical protein